MRTHGLRDLSLDVKKKCSNGMLMFMVYRVPTASTIVIRLEYKKGKNKKDNSFFPSPRSEEWKIYISWAIDELGIVFAREYGSGFLFKIKKKKKKPVGFQVQYILRRRCWAPSSSFGQRNFKQEIDAPIASTLPYIPYYTFFLIYLFVSLFILFIYPTFISVYTRDKISRPNPRGSWTRLYQRI